MQISDKNAPREIVTVKDFHRIAMENEFFMWHFLQKNQCSGRHVLCSYFEEHNNQLVGVTHTMKYLLGSIKVPYFESFTEESIDFLLDLGFKEDFLYQRRLESDFPVLREQKYSPLFIAFNRFKMVGSSPQLCYCTDHFIDLVMKLNPKFILDSNFD